MWLKPLWRLSNRRPIIDNWEVRFVLQELEINDIFKRIVRTETDEYCAPLQGTNLRVFARLVVQVLEIYRIDNHDGALAARKEGVLSPSLFL